MSGAVLCPQTALLDDLLDRREADELTSGESRALKLHLSSCAPCATAARRRDPLLVFAPLAFEEVSPAEAREVTGEILSAVSVARAQKRLAPRGLRGYSSMLRIAAALLVGAGIAGAVLVSRQDPRETVAESTVGPETFRPVPGPSGDAPGASFAARLSRNGKDGNVFGSPSSEGPAPSGRTVRSFAPAAPAVGPGTTRPLLEGLANRDATVYQFTPGSANEPMVVFIVDKNADL